MAKTRPEPYEIHTYLPPRVPFDVTESMTYGQFATHTSDPFHLISYPSNLISTENEELKNTTESTPMELKKDEVSEKDDFLQEWSYKLFLKKLDQHISLENHIEKERKEACPDCQRTKKEKELIALGTPDIPPTVIDPPLKELIPSKIRFSYATEVRVDALAKGGRKLGSIQRRF